jgi:hypothetical protein
MMSSVAQSPTSNGQIGKSPDGVPFGLASA